MVVMRLVIAIHGWPAAHGKAPRRTSGIPEVTGKFPAAYLAARRSRPGIGIRDVVRRILWKDG